MGEMKPENRRGGPLGQPLFGYPSRQPCLPCGAHPFHGHSVGSQDTCVKNYFYENVATRIPGLRNNEAPYIFC